jgi:hypothetical protein
MLQADHGKRLKALPVSFHVVSLSGYSAISPGPVPGFFLMQLRFIFVILSTI